MEKRILLILVSTSCFVRDAHDVTAMLDCDTGQFIFNEQCVDCKHCTDFESLKDCVDTHGCKLGKKEIHILFKYIILLQPNYL